MPSQFIDSGILASYLDAQRRREVVCRHGAHGTRLVTDRLAGTGEDERLVAHLEADEPAVNACIVCSSYLADARPTCRHLEPDDFHRVAIDSVATDGSTSEDVVVEDLTDNLGCVYRLEADQANGAVPELRWWRLVPDAGSPPEAVSVRDVVGVLERYDPVLALTRQAIAIAASQRDISCRVLRGQLRHVEEGRFVLNRRLRDAVHDAVRTRGLTLSEIAMSCGRVRRGPRGRTSGEVTWLRRRIGDVCESGSRRPTPWVSSGVFALIAREGLGINPCEAEVE